jgi:isoamylase
LPPEKYGRQWIGLLDTNTSSIETEERHYMPGETIKINGHSVVLLHHPLDN